MKATTFLTTLFLGTAIATPHMSNMNNDMQEDAIMKRDNAAMDMNMDSNLDKRQSGATLGTLLAAVDKIVSQIGKEVSDLKDPAKDLSDAIGAFQDAAKDVEVPSGKGGKSN